MNTTKLTAAQARGLANLVTDPTMRAAGRPSPQTRKALVAAGLIISDGRGGYALTDAGRDAL